MDGHSEAPTQHLRAGAFAIPRGGSPMDSLTEVVERVLALFRREHKQSDYTLAN